MAFDGPPRSAVTGSFTQQLPWGSLEGAGQQSAHWWSSHALLSPSCTRSHKMCLGLKPIMSNYCGLIFVTVPRVWSSQDLSILGAWGGNALRYHYDTSSVLIGTTAKEEAPP
jgi:hypothetical protein